MYYIKHANGTKEGPFDFEGAEHRIKSTYPNAAPRKDDDESKFYEPLGKDEKPDDQKPVAEIVSGD